MKLHVGTSGYSYKEWKGSFYPKSIHAKEMLRFYGKHFKTVEINNTFYRMPDVSVLEAWADSVPTDFKFALKASRQITHVLRLQNAEKPLSYLLDVTKNLKDRIGPILFQLPPHFKSNPDLLGGFIELLPVERLFAFEFRHPSWFDKEIMQLLEDHGKALCVSDAEEEPDAPFVSIGDWGYLRLRQPDYRDGDLKKWIQWIQNQGWRKAYVFFKHETDGPRIAARFLELAGQTPGLVVSRMMRAGTKG
ncbi:MAG: DUF72 domain-containing protein [Deltaproteobacteria bacterium]|nr:DUF72 domain-containing protein [Deltaproteobacteria bacterium]